MASSTFIGSFDQNICNKLIENLVTALGNESYILHFWPRIIPVFFYASNCASRELLIFQRTTITIKIVSYPFV